VHHQRLKMNFLGGETGAPPTTEDEFFGGETGAPPTTEDEFFGGETGAPPTTEDDFFDKKNIDINQSNLISVNILTDKEKYTEFEDINIWVKVEGNISDLIKLVLETRDSNKTLIHKSSKIVNVGNTNDKFYLHPGEIGIYNVTVTATQGNNTDTAFTMFKVVNIFTTNILIFIYISLSFFGALLILITVGLKNNLIDEILRFVFLSGIVASILASLLFTDLEFGTKSPIGLIKIKDGENAGNWVFNIGNALRIPIYVMVFGLIGGYIRYLYKTSNLINEVKNNINKSKSQTSNNSLNGKDNQIENTENSQTKPKDRIEVFYESLKDIAFFSLAPLLAIAVYFLLFAFGLSGDNAIYTQAVISFSIGLVTEDVIQALIRFTQERLSGNNSNNSNGK
jgi:hypothetical protein